MNSPRVLRRSRRGYMAVWATSHAMRSTVVAVLGDLPPAVQQISIPAPAELPTAKVDGPRVLQLIGKETGCTLWRTFGPCAELERIGYKADWAPLYGCPGCGWSERDDEDDREDDSPRHCSRCGIRFKPSDASLMTLPSVAAGEYDAMILPRVGWRMGEHQMKARRWIDSLHRAGLTVIGEYDDDLFSPGINARQQATNEPDKTLDQLEQERRDRIAALRMCDGVTVSNDNLSRVVRQYTDAPVSTVPNSIDLRWFRHTLRGVRRVVQPLTIGWAGGARYAEDLEPLAEAWANIGRRCPEVTFVVQGFMAEVLCDAVPADRVRRLPWLPLHEYPRALLNIDIGCAAVADKHFNRCKTPIKIWEYTTAGAACVVSPTLYSPVVSDGEDALVADTAAEWEAALARLVESEGLRRRLRRAQRRRVARDHSLERNVLKWPDAWASLIRQYREKRSPILLAS